MAADKPASSARDKGTRDGIKVLVVDDNAALRKQMSSLLSMEKDVEVIGTAANGRQAVEAVRSQSPDVVLMDLKMRGGSGIESAKAIKAFREDVAIIALTIVDSSETRQAAAEAGMSDFLVKGTPFKQILRSIRRSVRKEQS